MLGWFDMEFAKSLVNGWKKITAVQEFLDNECSNENQKIIVDMWIDEMVQRYKEHYDSESCWWWSDYDARCRSDAQVEISRRTKLLKDAKTYKEKAEFLLKHGR